MKKLNLLYILFCVAFISNAQIQEENFNANSLPSGWSMTTGPTGCAWQFGYTGNLIGSGSTTSGIYASFASGGVIFNDNDCGDFINNVVELEGPVIDLVAANVVSAGIELVYNHQTFGISGNFMVDVWDGSTWQNVLFVDGDDTAPNTGTNQTMNIDVSAYINSNFKVKFIYDDENSFTWGIGIDNYKLLNTATANIGDLVDLGFNYYPNPIVNDILTLQANEEISIVNVYNMIGQKVIAKKPVTLESKLNMKNLPIGMYIVNIAIGKKEGSFKIIKQ
jgi:hypothetical protein